MSGEFVVRENMVGHTRLSRQVAHLFTFTLAAAASVALTLTTYTEVMRQTHLTPLLILLIASHLMWNSRFVWHRELTLYSCLFCYMCITLLWTRDVDLAVNTLAPAANCVLIMIFYGSLIRSHDLRSALAGMVFGFCVGAALYTLTQGFPFSIPEDFSYNAIAAMYLFGLFVTLLYSCFRRSNGLLLVLALIIMLHIVATTSIKTNLGIALGLVVASIMYTGHFGRVLRRRLLLLVILIGGMGYAIASNDALQERIERGVQRVSVGLKVLEARDDVAGYSAFEKRDYWRQMGIEGWQLNPVFGYGTEAFRYDYEITSHSTPIDLLYNYGLIGLVLFYSVFASLSWRLVHLDSRRFSGERSLMVAGVICYVFSSLSGTLHYNVFLAAFLGISTSLLIVRGRRSRNQ